MAPSVHQRDISLDHPALLACLERMARTEGLEIQDCLVLKVHQELAGLLGYRERKAKRVTKDFLA